MKPECPLPEVLERVDAGVASIRRSVVINRTIYVLTLIIVIGLAVWLVKINAKQGTNNALIVKSITQNADIKAKLDVQEKQTFDYIEKTVAAILNKLQKDNPQINVPKAPALRPVGLPAPSDAELERPKSERPKPAPTPTPVVIVKPGKVKHVYVRPKPLWERIFKASPSPTPKKR